MYLSLFAATLLAAPQSLTLAEAQELAAKHNRDVQVAQERLGRAGALSKKAWSLLLPTVTATGSVVRNNQEISLPVGLPEDLRPLFESLGQPFPEPQVIEIQTQYQKNINANLTWPLLNGRAVPLIQNVQAGEDVAGLALRQVEVTVAYATALAYYNTLSAQRQVEIRQRALENRKAHLTLDQARAGVGEATEVQVLRSEVEVATAEQQLIQAENARRVADRALAVLIGLVGEDGTVPELATTRPPPEPVPQGDLVAQAHAERLDLRSQSVLLEIAERQRLETWMRFLPVLAATANWRWSDVTGFSGEHTSWQVGLLLSWNVFEGGFTYFELEERQHDINIAAITLTKGREDAAREVVEARLNFASAEAAHRVAQRAVVLAQRTAQLVDAQYRHGAASQLDVLDASRTLADAETNEALAQLTSDVTRLTLAQTLISPALEATPLAAPTLAPAALPASAPSLPAAAGAAGAAGVPGL